MSSKCRLPLFHTEKVDNLIMNLSYGTAAVMLVVSPLFLVPMLVMPRLRTLCRKTMSMIILSDLINSILLVIKSLLLRRIYGTVLLRGLNWIIYSCYIWTLLWLATLSSGIFSKKRKSNMKPLGLGNFNTRSDNYY